MNRKISKNIKKMIGIRKHFSVVIFLLIGSAVLWSQNNKVIALKSDDGKSVSIPLKNLTKNATFYSYKFNGKSIVRFFAILDNTNTVHVAFDACDVCFQARKGFRVINSLTICNNCGNQYPLAAIGTENIKGGCWPSFLPIKITNNAVVINLKDIETKKYLFPS